MASLFDHHRLPGSNHYRGNDATPAKFQERRFVEAKTRTPSRPHQREASQRPGTGRLEIAEHQEVHADEYMHAKDHEEMQRANRGGICASIADYSGDTGVPTIDSPGSAMT
jgi:hypothetical protein